MPRRTLESLGTIVRERRGNRKLREAAKDIGISPATLMRVESGRIPDVGTFGKICAWLGIDPGSFLGFEGEAAGQTPAITSETTSISISAHLKADQLPQPETVRALATLILLAAKTQAPTRTTTSYDEA
jgi:transcriptional regulator with XRE-family HTH domain